MNPSSKPGTELRPRGCPGSGPRAASRLAPHFPDQELWLDSLGVHSKAGPTPLGPWGRRIPAEGPSSAPGAGSGSVRSSPGTVALRPPPLCGWARSTRAGREGRAGAALQRVPASGHSCLEPGDPDSSQEGSCPRLPRPHHGGLLGPVAAAETPALQLEVLKLVPALDLGGLPRSLSGEEPTCQCRRQRRRRCGPRVGKTPGEGNDSPLQSSRLENPMDRGAWRARVHGVAESWARLKRLGTHLHWAWPSSSGERRGGLSAPPGPVAV